MLVGNTRKNAKGGMIMKRAAALVSVLMTLALFVSWYTTAYSKVVCPEPQQKYQFNCWREW